MSDLLRRKYHVAFNALTEINLSGGDDGTIARRALQRCINLGEDDVGLPARILAMCKKRGWKLNWSARGCYLHLEASEFIEALRGKRGDPIEEAADVLLVLMSTTEAHGIAWDKVLAATEAKCAQLEAKPPYPGESTEAKP